MNDSQNAQLIAIMETGRWVTQIDALNEVGCTRLSARIYDLRKMGYKITGKDKTKKLPNGRIKRWKVYRFAGRGEA